MARNLAMNIFKLRDALATIVNERPYREYPVDWVVRNLKKSGYIVDQIILFPILWGQEALYKQLQNGYDYLKKATGKDLISDPYYSKKLLKDMEKYLNHFKNILYKSELIHNYGLCYGVDYVVVARKIN